MLLNLTEALIDDVAELGHISIAFTVDRIYEVSTDRSDGRFLLSERLVDAPYVKDYDRLGEEGPLHWASRFDIGRWGLLQVRIVDAACWRSRRSARDAGD